MSWKLWLDDQADEMLLDEGVILRPTPEGFITAHSSQEAIKLVRKNGPPEFMDLDCDLGGIDSAMRFLKWLAYEYNIYKASNEPGILFGNYVWPPRYVIHSENCVERLNVESFMESWKKSLEL